MNTLQEYIYKKHFNILKSELSENTKNVKIYQITKGNNAINNLIALTEKEYKTYTHNKIFIDMLQKIHIVQVKMNKTLLLMQK